MGPSRIRWELEWTQVVPLPGWSAVYQALVRQLTATVSKQAISGIVESWTGRFSRHCLRKSGAGWSLGLGGGPTIAMK